MKLLHSQREKRKADLLYDEILSTTLNSITKALKIVLGKEKIIEKAITTGYIILIKSRFVKNEWAFFVNFTVSLVQQRIMRQVYFSRRYRLSTTKINVWLSIWDNSVNVS